MNLAILSGKGGTGKTFVSTNLAVAAGKAVYVDCDVEEPNGRLFLRPENVETTAVSTPIPSFDPERCTGCRACVDHCRFHALVFIKGAPQLFTEGCHGCGGCLRNCPSGAIREIKRPIGQVEEGTRGELSVITGEVNLGEASGVGVIQAAIRQGKAHEGLHILDCPPGSGCAVLDCVSKSDKCILVTEPTAFGFHNFRMVHELCTLLGKPCGVVINKAEGEYAPLEDFCRETHTPILARFPYSARLAMLGAEGRLAAEEDPETAERFRTLLDKIGGEWT